MQGSSDESVLTDIGRSAALDAGAALKGIRFDRVIASPLARARQTCELIMSINQAGSAPPEFDIELRETNMYGWEGQSMVELRDTCPEQWHNWHNDPAAMVLEHNGKMVYPLRDLYARAEKFVRDNLESGREENILLVSHGGTNQALINSALGLDVTHHQTFQQSNCCISQFSLDMQTGSYQLVQLNNTAPLGEKLPKLKARKEGVRVVFVHHDDERGSQCGSRIVEELELKSSKIRDLESESADLAGEIRLLSEDRENLHNLVVLHSANRLEDIIRLCFKLPAALTRNEIFRKGHVTVVHHSQSHPKPIIQCINQPLSAS